MTHEGLTLEEELRCIIAGWRSVIGVVDHDYGRALGHCARRVEEVLARVADTELEEEIE